MKLSSSPTSRGSRGSSRPAVAASITATAAAAAALATGLALMSSAACAQQPAPPSSAASTASTASAAAPARAASAPGRAASASAAAAAAQSQQRVEITGGRNAEVDERRQSTAAKIIIGREEIDKFGDANVGEVLRRLPGVTTPGAPGRGGPPRMRGLGNGYTQLLIDGQRIPPGFTLDSLTPEQVERIEILRAPTAETGSQAIAGTINIITREGFKRRLNDLRGGISRENGKLAPGINWTHNDSAGDLSYNVSGSTFFPRRENRNSTRTTVESMTTGAPLEDRTVSTLTDEKRFGMNLTSRLQWRLGEAGDLLSLSPSVFHTEGQSSSRSSLLNVLSRPSTLGLYDQAASDGDNRYTNGRLGLQWRQRVGPLRLELNGGGGSFKAVSNSLRNESSAAAGGAAVLRVLEDHSSVRENALNLVLKGSGAAGGNGVGQGEHNLVGGAEIDASRRNESKTSLQNGLPLLTDYSSNLQAQALRTAAYLQDEWAVNPNWSVQGGLRWEGIHTRGDNGNTAAADPNPSNQSSVWTPLFHAVWKPDEKQRDQVRLSLTRSYRPPALGTLIARPSISRDYPVSGANIFTSPDSTGNPALQPELAAGIDLAFERYLDGGGVLSANLFRRDIRRLMRSLTSLQTVSWSPVPRYVRRMENIGDATTSGLELDAKFRLDQLFSGAPGVELRGNLAFYASRVKSVPGPDNRLDQQARATGNFGADYRLRSIPLTLGGNLNQVPGYTTRTDVGQTVQVSTKSVWDAYALWTFSPTVALRLLGSNLDPRDYTNTTVSEITAANLNERTTVSSTGPSYINWQLRLELKL